MGYLNTNIVECNKLTKTFDNLTVVDELSLAVKQGSILVLLGPSGSGKTTTLRLIAGFEEPDSGVIKIGDKPISDRIIEAVWGFLAVYIVIFTNIVNKVINK